MPNGRSLCHGYVLTGGRSRRMGQDKGLLSFGDGPLAVWVAERVQQVCKEVSLVGDPAKYAAWVFPVIEDVIPEQGPLGGIHAALAHSDARFTLVVGCDMPYLSPDFLRLLLRIAQETDADAVVPGSEEFEYEPLCAVYARSCLAPIEEALRGGQRKIKDAFRRLRLRAVSRAEWKPYDPEGRLFQNLNTPEDYEQARRELLLRVPEPRA